METLFLLFFAITVYLITLWRLMVEFKKDRNRIIVSHSNSMKYLLSRIKNNMKQNIKNKNDINDIKKEYEQRKSILDSNFDQNFAAHEQLRNEIRLNESKINNIDNNNLFAVVNEEI